MLDRFTGYAPERLLIFCTPDYSRIDDPDFAAQVVQGLERARANGAAGVKIFKNLGLTLRDKSGRIVGVDDPRLDPIWATAGRLNMPVLIHSGDPAAFFEPIDRHNERWMQLNRHPSWSFGGPRFPARAQVLAQRNRMIARHRGTNFIGAHMGGNAEDLEALGKVLDALPNFYVDICGRVAELGRQPYSARRFFRKYADRILYATDRHPGRDRQPRYRIYYRFLETADEYFDYYNHPFPPTGEWKIYGIYLPDDVLKKVYRENADRLLGLGKPQK
jgi:predicted TIM-barrel fold metal-dependent hydrolase